MTIANFKKNIVEKMQKSLDTLRTELAKVRTGHAHVGMLDAIKVDYYGTPTRITDVAQISLLDPRTLGVRPFEKKMLSVIEKAIRESDIGVNPASLGEIIRVPVPPLTEERRKEMVKLVKSEGEASKVAVRNIRREGNDDLKKRVKDKECSEDEERRASEEIQKLTDKFIADIDKTVADKEKDVLTV